jgi:antirestriction protein ArdC
MPHDRSQKRDLYESVTAHIIDAIEKGAGDFQMPWHQQNGPVCRPKNIASKKPYNGINVVTLWGAAYVRGYEAPVWGTFKQWLEVGCPVRKGERAVPGIFYKELRIEEERDGEATQRRIPMARGFSLFNAAQVEGYVAPPPVEAPALQDQVTPLLTADALVRQSGAVIVEGGDSAYYSIGRDAIQMPDRALFTGTDTSTPTEGFYGVLLHELTHWSGAKHRLDRNLADRSKEESVALEELVAELGSAMLCADLGVAQQPRLDHARYIATWLLALRNDKKAIFVASSAAQKAVDYLQSFNPHRPASEPLPTDEPEPL